MKEAEPELGEQGLQSKEGINGKRVSFTMLAPLVFLSGHSNGGRTLSASFFLFAEIVTILKVYASHKNFSQRYSAQVIAQRLSSPCRHEQCPITCAEYISARAALRG